MKYIVPILLIFISFQQQVFSQQGPIETDRPDQTESPSIVPKKWIQMETGFTKQADRYQPSFTRVYWFHHPTLLTKYGVGKRFELRLITELSTYKEKDDTRVYYKTGISAVELGGKLNLCKEKGWRPKTSLIAHYEFGHLRTLFHDTIDGLNFRFTMQHTLSSKLSLGYNLGMRWELFKYYPPAFVYTFAPGYSISEKWYAYVEAFGSIWKDSSPENNIAGGAAFNVNDNFKIDASGGIGISKEAPAYYFSLGASIRFKTSKSLLQ
ncbi:MAG: transporter [Ferruginibacter sp.]